MFLLSLHDSQYINLGESLTAHQVSEGRHYVEHRGGWTQAWMTKKYSKSLGIYRLVFEDYLSFYLSFIYLSTI